MLLQSNKTKKIAENKAFLYCSENQGGEFSDILTIKYKGIIVQHRQMDSVKKYSLLPNMSSTKNSDGTMKCNISAFQNVISYTHEGFV